MPSPKRIQIIVNPAAGQNTPVLATLNEVFRPLNVDWDISVTKKAGDAREQAQLAAQQGVDVVAAYGGDGTVTEVASGLLGSNVPLAILPGGTGNVTAIELGIPTDLGAACMLAAGNNSKVTTSDCGDDCGDDCGELDNHLFLLRLSVGLEAEMVENASREAKTRYGIFAYLWSALQNLRQPEVSQFQLTLDGQAVVTEGVTCIIANSGNLGLSGVKLLPTVAIDDGLLDVIVLQQANLTALFEVMGNVLGIRETPLLNAATQPSTHDWSQSLQVWQAREIAVITTPPRVIQADGEIIGQGPIRCRVLPHALKVITPDLAAA